MKVPKIDLREGSDWATFVLSVRAEDREIYETAISERGEVLVAFIDSTVEVEGIIEEKGGVLVMKGSVV